MKGEREKTREKMEVLVEVEMEKKEG